MQMAALEIVTGKDTPILRAKTVKVKQITKDMLKLIKDMELTRIKADGAGIAAPQVGRSERICIAAVNGEATALINPEILWKSDEKETEQEGCLSLPNIWIEVPRSKEIIVRFTDFKGKEQELKLTDWSARVVQHEVDHLDGKLIVDYVSG